MLFEEGADVTNNGKVGATLMSIIARNSATSHHTSNESSRGRGINIFRGWRFASLLVILSGFLGDALARFHHCASIASLLFSCDLVGELLKQPLGEILDLL